MLASGGRSLLRDRSTAGFINGLSFPRLDCFATVVVVDQLPDGDDGECAVDCSLREAADVVPAGGLIKFDPSLTNPMLLLGSPLIIDKSVLIDGSDPPASVVIGDGGSPSVQARTAEKQGEKAERRRRPQQ